MGHDSELHPTQAEPQQGTLTSVDASRDEASRLREECQKLSARVQELEGQLARVRNATPSISDWAARTPAERLWGRGVQDQVAFRKVVERLAHYGCFAWDGSDDRFEGSSEFARIMGLGEQGGRIAGHERVVAAVHEEDRAGLRDLFSRARAGSEDERLDVRVFLSELDVRDVTVLASAVRVAEGRIHDVVGTVIDSTEHVEARRAMNHAYDHLNESQQLAQVGSWLVDLDTGATEWTPETFRILGVDLDVRPSRQQLMACIHEEDRPRMMELEAGALAGCSFPPSELRIVTPDGSERQVYVTGRVEQERSGRRHYWGTLMDVTGRRSLEQQLLQAQKLEALGRLSGSIAHDFNNLLTVILLNTTMLRVSHPESRELAQVEEAAVQAASVTGQLLAFSRRSIRRLRAIDVNHLVCEALGWLERILGEHIVMTFTPSPTQVVVSSDEAQLRQVLLNLVINARDAMPEGGEIRVSITSVQREAADEGEGRLYACIRVADTGVGMDAHTRARLFEPFFSTKQPGQGSGLGLSTVFGIVRQHDGFVDVDSQPQRGAEFRVFLPQTFESPAESPNKHALTLSPRGRETLLLVEDERLVRITMSALLSDAGYEVLVADQPSHAIALWHEHRDRVRLLVTDIVMPGMSGGQLAKRLRTECADLSVLFVTGYDPRAEAVRMERTWSIMKPFEPKRLLEMVRVALDADSTAMTNVQNGVVADDRSVADASR